jgi:ABC-type sugar transport system permease subunit
VSVATLRGSLTSTAGDVRRHLTWERAAPYLFVSPFAIAFLLLFAGPALYSLVLSLFRYRGYGTATFIGADNYIRLLQYHQFWSSFLNTVIYWIASATITLVASFLLAVVVSSAIRSGQRTYKPLLYLPHVMAIVAASLVFQSIFAPESGVINTLLGVRLAWNQDPLLGKVAVVTLRSWQSIGFFFVIFLAGLTTINPELYEAARVDGARAWQNLRFITLPLLRPTILFAVVIASIYSIRMFAEPNLLFSNNQAPAEFQPIMNQLYQNLQAGMFGNAAAAAWLIFIPVVLVAFIQFRLLRGDPTAGDA